VEVLAEFRRITIPLVCTGGCHSFRLYQSLILRVISSVPQPQERCVFTDCPTAGHKGQATSVVK